MVVKHLRLVDRPASATARDALLRRGKRIDVATLLDDAVLRAQETDVPGRAAVSGFTWEPHDSGTELWYPQGVTTSADATGSGAAGTSGRNVVVVSWYAHEGALRNGARLTFVDLDTLHYRHVLLVRARRTPWGVCILPVPIHAGGIAWYGPYLYVAATRAGVYVFRVEDLLELPPRRRKGVAGRLGYDMVLPVHHRLTSRGRDAGSRVRYSFLSLAHGLPDTDSPPALVAGEYGGVGKTQRLWRYALDPETHLPRRGADGHATPDELHPDQSPRMQGATVLDGTWYVTTSQGRGNAGDLLVGEPGAFRRHKRVLPTGCEDIAAWPQRRQLWSVTEWPWMRWVYAVDADAWPGPVAPPPAEQSGARPIPPRPPASGAAPS
ncbi:hypothetical protein [Mumia sp. Pv 4-285]|uniref:hypothetical protein n=1 Tax=Mumia qirimensis TaxID=3234852 RepID=UPI00351D90AF